MRLPEGSMRASAGTDVVIDLLVFQRRAEDQAPAGAAWIDLVLDGSAATGGRGIGDDSEYDHRREPAITPRIQVNRYFAEHPEMVLGEHAHAARHLRPRPDLHLPAALRTARRLRPC